MEQSSQTAPARRQRRPWTEEDQKTAEKMRAEGANLKAIGRCIGRDSSSIKYHLDSAFADHKRNYASCFAKKNPEKRRQLNRQWVEANRDKIRGQERLRYKINRDTIRESQRLNYKANKETVLEKNRQWREANRDMMRERRRMLYKTNRDKIREQKRLRYKSNPLKILEKNREWAKANPENRREARQRWIERNPDKRRENCRRRRALCRTRRKEALTPITLHQIHHRFALFDGSCAYCGSKDELSVDHVMPLISGGLDEAANIAPACKRCNCSKGARPVEDWYRRQPFFTEARWRKIQRHCPAAVAGQLPLALAVAKS